MMMPVMDGCAVRARLMEDERTKTVPVIVLSARGDIKAHFDPAIGVTTYVEKPFDPKVLREAVASLLKKH